MAKTLPVAFFASRQRDPSGRPAGGLQKASADPRAALEGQGGAAQRGIASDRLAALQADFENRVAEKRWSGPGIKGQSDTEMDRGYQAALSQEPDAINPNATDLAATSKSISKGFVPLIRDELPAHSSAVETTPEGTQIYERPDGTHYEVLKDGSTMEIITVSGRAPAYSRDIRAAIKKGATRVGPAPGWRNPAVKGQVDANGQSYADGRYSIDGRERWRLKRDGSGRRHTGIDIPGAHGDPIYAPASGVVVGKTNIRGYGNVVLIDHQDGTTTMAAHLDTRLVKPGDRVRIGDVIGTMGNSGNARGQGTHVHFEAIETKSGRKLDPRKWIKGGSMPS